MGKIGTFLGVKGDKMNEISGVYDENDPKTKKRLEFLAELNARARAKITSWQDLYDGLKEVCGLYSSAPSPRTASAAVVLLHSFVIALEQLPGEGDALAIAYRTNEVMVMRHDLTGILLCVDADEAGVSALLRLAEAFRSIAADAGEGPATDTVPETQGRRLH